MGTRGKVKALTALGARRSKGKAPVIGGKKAKRKATKQAAASTKSAKRAAKLVKGKPGKKVKPGAFAKKKG